jgi:hypothetical protein
MRYRLRTLLLLLVLGPPLLAAGWWKYAAHQAEMDRHRAAVAARQAVIYFNLLQAQNQRLKARAERTAEYRKVLESARAVQTQLDHNSNRTLTLQRNPNPLPPVPSENDYRFPPQYPLHYGPSKTNW